MQIAQEYRNRAVEAEQLAQAALSEDRRQRIMAIAQTWRALADRRERQMKGWPTEWINAPLRAPVRLV